MKLLQVWQYGQPKAAETCLADAIATAKTYGFDGLAVKALDGLDWMRTFDSHPDALGSIDQVAAQTAQAHAQGLAYWCWTNPRHDVDVVAEATLTGQIALACDGVLVDTEPYRQFWNNDAPAGLATEFMTVLRQTAPDAQIVLQPDPRPQALAGIKVDEWMPGCNAIAGQHYWTDFSSDPSAELVYAEQIGQRFGKPVYPTLPGNADPLSVPADLVASFPGFVVWRLGSAGPAMLQVLGAIVPTPLPTPQPAPRETPDDWEWLTWREAAINYRGIADALGTQVSSAQAQLQQATQERDAAQGQTGTLSGVLEQKLQAITDLQARITAAGQALGLVQGTP